MQITNTIFKTSVITASFLTLFAFPLTNAFAINSGATNVSGIITDSSGKVLGASVTVTCSNGHIETTTSKTGGIYKVTFPADSADNCPNTDSLTVTATDGIETGSNTGTFSDDDATINVTIASPIAVPEFNIYTGITAVLGAAGAFIFLKKKRII